MKRSHTSVWNLAWVMAKTDFKLRYHGSVLGFFWALLKPLFVFAILYVVFSNVFAADVPYYALQLLTGLVLWNFFAEASMMGLTSLKTKAHLITKMPFPRIVVALAALLQALMNFVVQLIMLLAVFVVLGIDVSFWQAGLLVMYLAFLIAMVAGFVFFAAPAYVRFRDLNQIWEVLLMGGFYAAPVIYPLSIIPESFRAWLYINPMTFFIEHFRAVLFMGDLSRLDHHLIFFVAITIFLVIGYQFFIRFEQRVVELL